MSSEAEKRKHPRMRVTFDVEVYHPTVGLNYFQTRDMSHNGMFIVDNVADLLLPALGEIVRVIIKGLSLDEPMTVDMRVVRNSFDGKGLVFV
jgi:PilZ domain-containing protein